MSWTRNYDGGRASWEVSMGVGVGDVSKGRLVLTPGSVDKLRARGRCK